MRRMNSKCFWNKHGPPCRPKQRVVGHAPQARGGARCVAREWAASWHGQAAETGRDRGTGPGTASHVAVAVAALRFGKHNYANTRTYPCVSISLILTWWYIRVYIRDLGRNHETKQGKLRIMVTPTDEQIWLTVTGRLHWEATNACRGPVFLARCHLAHSIRAAWGHRPPGETSGTMAAREGTRKG